MDQDLQKAAAMLAAGNYTFVLCRGDVVLTDTRRGIRPLLELLEAEQNLEGFCAADKVVGKAAAFLYRLMGVQAVWAPVISVPAARVLNQGGIAVYQNTEVPAILNRSRTGLCPIETAVWSIENPQEALEAIKGALSNL